jgi:hypothetical protein
MAAKSPTQTPATPPTSPERVGSMPMPAEPNHIAIHPARVSRFIARAEDIEFLRVKPVETSNEATPEARRPEQPDKKPR